MSPVKIYSILDAVFIIKTDFLVPHVCFHTLLLLPFPELNAYANYMSLSSTLIRFLVFMQSLLPVFGEPTPFFFPPRFIFR